MVRLGMNQRLFILNSPSTPRPFPNRRLAESAPPSLVHGLIRKVSLPFWSPAIAWSKKRQTTMAKVVKTSEKGSDVNLATHLLHDAYRNKFEAAVLITGDSDLLEAVRIVSKEVKKIVGVICPQLRQHMANYR